MGIRLFFVLAFVSESRTLATHRSPQLVCPCRRRPQVCQLHQCRSCLFGPLARNDSPGLYRPRIELLKLFKKSRRKPRFKR